MLRRMVFAWNGRFLFWGIKEQGINWHIFWGALHTHGRNDGGSLVFLLFFLVSCFSFSRYHD